MRFFLFLILSCSVPSHSQTVSPLTREGDLYTLVGSSPNAGEAHLSGNDFARLVGDELKRRYPARILNPTVGLVRFINDEGVAEYRLTWSCRIVTASEEEADYIFDRRGTLLPGSTVEEARRKVIDEIAASGKVRKLRAALDNDKVPPNFTSDSCTGSTREGYWCIRETFVVAPKSR